MVKLALYFVVLVCPVKLSLSNSLSFSPQSLRSISTTNKQSIPVLAILTNHDSATHGPC